MTDVFKAVLATAQRERWEHKGVQCAIHFVPRTWTFTGYCLIPKGHPLEKSPYWGEPYASPALLDVHGGVTFGPEPAEGGHIIGFDTAHADDWSPFWPGGRQWSLDEVIEETNRMAEQIAQVPA